MAAVDARVFEKIARRDASEKFFFRDEMIIVALDFSGAWRARRARDRVNKIRRLAERGTERRLSRARRRGDHEQNSGAAKLLTQGFGFARGFSPIPICRQRRAARSGR